MKILQLSIIVILSLSLIISIDAVFAENDNNTNNNFKNYPAINDSNVPRGGFIQVLFATDPVYPDSSDQTNLEFDFVNKETDTVQQDVDYKISINQGSNQLYTMPTTHSAQGSVTFPFRFQNSGYYQIVVEVYGISFNKIPVENSTFNLTVSQSHTSSQTTSLGMSQNSIPLNQSYQNSNSNTTLQQSNSISTDRSSYRYGDTISMTGSFSELYNNTILNFFILNPSQEAVSSHGFIGGSDGRFDALVVASGPKWNQSGTYTVILKSSQGIIAQTTFGLSGQEISTPEFGSLSITIVTISIIGTVIISRRFRFHIHE